MKKASFLLTLIFLLGQFSPAFAMNNIEAKKFLACESKQMQYEELSIRLDRYQKADRPDAKKISHYQRGVNVVNKYLDKFCTSYTASNF